MSELARQYLLLEDDKGCGHPLDVEVWTLILAITANSCAAAYIAYDHYSGNSGRSLLNSASLYNSRRPPPQMYNCTIDPRPYTVAVDRDTKPGMQGLRHMGGWEDSVLRD